MTVKELLEALYKVPFDYEVNIVTTDDVGTENDVGTIETVELRPENKFVVLHAVPVGC